MCLHEILLLVSTLCADEVMMQAWEHALAVRSRLHAFRFFAVNQ